MFELLLQADKALAGGLLDQAEKTYWQLIELDPSNAIAVAGLANVAMQRGDERMARDFAERALAIDPDSILAHRLIEAVDHTFTESSGDGPEELPLLAVAQLEALSRRRGTNTSRSEGGSRMDTRGTSPEAADEQEAGRAVGPRPVTEPEPIPGKTGTGVGRGKTRPDQISALPTEPLRERRKAGRLAAAAAAAAAAAREPVRTRHEPHHAMPVGRYHFDPGSLKAPPADEFSAAEMAAAVAAVDALDDVAVLDATEAADAAEAAAAAAATAESARAEAADAAEAAAAAAATAESARAEAAQFAAAELAATELQASWAIGRPKVLDEIDTAGADDGIEPTVALPGDDAGMDAAEREAAQIGEADSFGEFAAAEAEAQAALYAPDDTPWWRGPVVGAEPVLDEFAAAEAEAEAAGFVAAEPGATPEFDAFAAAEAEAEAASFASVHPIVAPEPYFQSEAAAEAEAAAAAVNEVAGTDAITDEEPSSRRHRFEPPTHQAPTEEEAEAQALREAMAIVLAGEGEARSGEGEARSGEGEARSGESESRSGEGAARSGTGAPAAPIAWEDSNLLGMAGERSPSELAGELAGEPELEAATEPVGEATAPGNPEPAVEEQSPPEPRPARHGLFHRIRGN